MVQNSTEAGFTNNHENTAPSSCPCATDCSKPSIAIHSFAPHGSAWYNHLLLQTELYPPAPATKFTSCSPDPKQGCTRSKEEANRKSGP